MLVGHPAEDAVAFAGEISADMSLPKIEVRRVREKAGEIEADSASVVTEQFVGSLRHARDNGIGREGLVQRLGNQTGIKLRFLLIRLTDGLGRKHDSRGVLRAGDHRLPLRGLEFGQISRGSHGPFAPQCLQRFDE